MIELKNYIHHSKDLEKAILGACLLEKLAFGRIYGIVDVESFYFDDHKLVFQSLKEMFDQNIPIDSFTLLEFMARTGRTFSENSEYVIAGLTNAVVSSAHLEYHCHLVKDMWRKRKVIELKYKSLQSDDPGENIRDIQTDINQILSGHVRRDWYDMSQLMYDLILHQEDMKIGRRSFVTTGFKKLDQLNGGFYNGQLVVIGARPSVGKSALMGQMALTMARNGKKVGIISLEMNNTEIAARLASIETGIDFGTIFRTIAHDEALHKRFYDKVSRETINLPIYLSDKTQVGVNEIRAKAIKLKASKGCDCLMVDYLQLIDTTERNYNREQEVAKMSRGLKLMAQELDVPVVLLCQLNRQVTARSYKDRFPKLSDLRESGAIEQDADVVMFIHRDYMSGWQTDESGRTTEFEADLLVPKWRNGATCHLPLDFDPPKMKFSERKETSFVPVASLPYKDKEDPF